MVSIRITDGDRKTLQTAYARYMATAVNDAIADARSMLSDHHPTLYLRDCLGGLRAEVRLRDGQTTVIRTP